MNDSDKRIPGGMCYQRRDLGGGWSVQSGQVDVREGGPAHIGPNAPTWKPLCGESLGAGNTFRNWPKIPVSTPVCQACLEGVEAQVS
jgi:hypothetical protein